MPNLKIEYVAGGYKSRITEPGSHVIQTAEEWENLHRRLNRGGRDPSHYGLEFDFSGVTLLAVCLGEVAANSAIKIARVSDISDKLQVEVQQNIGESSDLWYPFHVVKLPKVSKPIEFEYRDNPDLIISDIRHCG